MRNHHNTPVGLQLPETLVRTIRCSVRQIRRNPGFASVVVLTLALGIGANTTIFSIFNALLLRELPVPAPAQIVRVGPGDPFSYPDYVTFRDQCHSFEALAADFGLPLAANLGSEDFAQHVFGVSVTGNFFSTLGVKFALGRGFLPGEDMPSDPKRVVVLSYAFWRRGFGGDASILGKEVLLNGSGYTVIGVTQKDFQGVVFGLAPDFWAPTATLFTLNPRLGSEQPLTNRDLHSFGMIGRIRRGVSHSQALAEINMVNDRLRRASGNWGKPRLDLSNPAKLPRGLGQLAFGVTTALMILSGVVLMIACANLANLLLARGLLLRKELAIRLALGASRAGLVFQQMATNLMLSILGAGVAFLLSAYAARAISGVDLPLPFPISLDFSPDITVLLVATAVAVLASIIFGLVPALRATGVNVSSVLKDGDSTYSILPWRNLRTGLVVAQVALAVVALTAAGLFLRSQGNWFSANLGFRPENILVLRVDPKLQGYSDSRCALFFPLLQKRILELANVRAASFVSPLPLTGINTAREFTVAGPSETGTAALYVAGAHYFQTMGIPVLSGRDFTDHESAPALVAIISETMAKRFFPGKSPIGGKVDMVSQGGNRTYEVIGVAGDTKSRSIGEPIGPVLYARFDQNVGEAGRISTFGGMSVVVKTISDPNGLIPAIRQQVQQIDPGLPAYGVKTMRDQVASALVIPRLAAALTSVFGALALTLTAVGLYGVVSCTLASRTREIAIRMALGASRRRVLGMLAIQHLGLSSVGLALGLGLGLAGGRLISNFLYGVSGSDPLTFGAVSMVAITVSCFTFVLPVLRATRVDLVVSLRHE